MAIRNKALTVNFLAWDTVNNVGKTGDSANITLRTVRDGSTPAAVTNTVSEPSSATMPGIYQITLTATEMDGNFVCVSGKSTTTGVVVYPVFMQTERGDMAALQTLIEQIKAKTDNLPSDPARESTLSSAQTAILALVASNGTKIDSVATVVTTNGTKIDNVATVVASNGTKIDTVSNNVVLLRDDGVRLNVQGKLDVKTAASACLNVDTIPELGSAPGSTPTLTQAVMLQYMSLRNKTENEADIMRIFKNDGSVLATAALSDDGEVFMKQKLM